MAKLITRIIIQKIDCMHSDVVFPLRSQYYFHNKLKSFVSSQFLFIVSTVL